MCTGCAEKKARENAAGEDARNKKLEAKAARRQAKKDAKAARSQERQRKKAAAEGRTGWDMSLNIGGLNR